LGSAVGFAVLTSAAGCDPVKSSECQAAISAAADEARSEEEEQWRVALEEANATIQRLNSEIEDAQVYAGAGYDEMEFALVNLETGQTVDEP
jgi:hypothetical protein